jgi:uncharacterized membrane protein YbhN (UPF0104 family)
MKHPTLMLLLKTLVSVGLILFFLSRVDLTEFLRVLSSAHIFYLAIALMGYFLGQIICSLRWSLLARPLGFENPFKDYVVLYFIGMFFNLFAPSTVGGDVSRVFYLARGAASGREKGWTGSTVSALISVIADRAIGMAVLVWIGAVALLVFPMYSLPLIIRYSTFALALGLLLTCIVLPFLTRFLQQRRHPLGKNLSVALKTYWRHGEIILQSFMLSLVTHIIQAWMQVLLGRALDVEIPWSYSLILYPLVGVFSALPISLNGIGLREGGYLFLLQKIDVSSEKAIAFGVLWFIIVALDSLFGGAVFILKKSSRPSPVVSETQSSRAMDKAVNLKDR